MIKVIIVLLSALIVSTHEHDVPKLLQRINKALGLPEKSETLWDILTIANNTNEITDLKERVDQLEECCNCTQMAFDSILVSTGYPLSSATKTEIINTDNSGQIGLTCKDLEEYPLQIIGAVGFNLASLPVICGGWMDGTYLNQCHRMESGEWKHFANLTQGRSYAAGISYGQSSIIFGGFHPDSWALSSTEIITEQGVSAGPDMPEASWDHAIASVDETTSILTGGKQCSSCGRSNKTWFFSHVSQQFQAGPTLITARSLHASATIKDKVTMENIVAVIGGYNINGTLDSTELLINGDSAWQQGPQMPKKLAFHSAVEIGGDLYTLGGSSNDGYQTAIYRMSCWSRVCTWTTMTQKLKLARRNFVAIAIPKSFCVPLEQ